LNNWLPFFVRPVPYMAVGSNLREWDGGLSNIPRGPGRALKYGEVPEVGMGVGRKKSTLPPNMDMYMARPPKAFLKNVIACFYVSNSFVTARRYKAAALMEHLCSKVLSVKIE
jgi:hypothetical protein